MSDAEIAAKIPELFDMRPRAIEKRLGLRQPIYRETATYGHMGRTPEETTKVFASRYDREPLHRDVQLFAWEKLDMTDAIRAKFGLE